MQKKIIISLISSVLLTVALASCSSDNGAHLSTQATASSSTGTTVTQPVTPTTPAYTPPPVVKQPTPTLTTAQAEKGSATVVADFYNGTFKVSHKNILAAQKLNTNYKSYSAAAYTKKMEALIPALKDIYKGDSTTDRIATFEYGYTSVVLGVADLLQQQAGTNFKFIVNPSSVTIANQDNTLASVEASSIEVEYKGKVEPSNSTSSTTLQTIYKHGKWYIDAENS